MLLRALVIDALGESEEERVLEEGRKRFEEMAKQAEGSDAKPLLQTDLISPVYRMVAATEGERGFEKLLARFRASDFSEEQRRCLVALGSASEEQLLNRLLDFCLTDAVRSQDIVFGISAVSHNPKGRQLAWDFLRERWEIFDQKFGGGQFLISHIIGAVASAFDSEEKAKEVEAFFETHPSPSAQRTIQQSLERIRNNAAFLTREAAPIGAWLQERFGRGN
ncbi:Aminopeptidase [Balamuthia mandrillaris]